MWSRLSALLCTRLGPVVAFCWLPLAWLFRGLFEDWLFGSANDWLLKHVGPLLPSWMAGVGGWLWSLLASAAILLFVIWATRRWYPANVSVLQPWEAAAADPRRLDTRERQELVGKLRALANEHTNVKIVFFPAESRPLVEALDGVFNAAGWRTNPNLTPQGMHNPHYHSGVEVRGFNRHLVDGVCVALREAGILDARTNLVPLEVPRNNPKWPTSQHKVYLNIGYVEDGPR